ncbi:MAG: iron-sulfur cluster assembly scaffold protein [Candidatus Caenarcaniphilales bacterium]|nr:iron-sulfur cluster assembly scaffold protein [Candidatus Caenarcaniphilales bacterium]
MEFNKEKFSSFVMDRPYLGKIEAKDLEEGELVYHHALDKAGCGDSYELWIKTDNEKHIKDAKYITFGCGYAQATCCALIEAIKEKNVSEIFQWSEKEVCQQIETVMGEYPIHKKAYMFFAKELLDGVCKKALGQEDLVNNVAKN